MADLRPPGSLTDERATLMGLLQFQRDSVVRKVAGLSQEDAARPGTPSGTSLLWLVQHLRRAERIWVLDRFAGQEVDVWDDAVRLDEPLAESIARYQATWADVAAIVDAEPDLEGTCQRIGGDTQRNLRWVIGHLLEETARHAGHADILRELLDGQTGR